jgi:long-subunit fatty acid transport protein
MSRPVSGMASNMGGTAIGVQNDHNVVLGNPANLGGVSTTAFSTFVTIEGVRTSLDANHTNQMSVFPHQVSFAFPLDVFGTIAFSLSKQSNAALMFQKDSAIGLGEVARMSFDRSGGMTSWQLGWGKSLGKFGNVGLSYERLYLTLHNTQLVTLASSTEAGSRDSTDVTFGGNSLRLGVMVPYKKLTAGLVFNYIFDGDLHYQRGKYREVSMQPFYDSSATIKTSMPMMLGLGASYQFSPEWLAGADMNLTDWSRINTNQLSPEPLRTALGFSAGAQFIPAPNLLAPKYWETIRYRAGFRIEQLPISGNAEFAISLGTGLPLISDGLIDLIIEGGQRFDVNYSNYNEKFLKLGIGINGGRTWRKTSASGY